MFIILVCGMSAVRRCKDRDNFGRMQIFSEIFLVAAIDGCDIDTKRGNLAATKMMGYGDKNRGYGDKDERHKKTSRTMPAREY